MPVRPLYEIDAELEGILNALESPEMNLSEEEVQIALDEWLSSNMDEIAVKLDGYCQAIASREGMAKIRKEEAQALQAMAQFDTKTADMLKDRMKSFLKLAGLNSVVTAHFKPNVRANGGVQPMKLAYAVELNPSTLPPWAQKIVPNNEAIRKALEAGVAIEGLPDAFAKEPIALAYLTERGDHVRLR